MSDLAPAYPQQFPGAQPEEEEVVLEAERALSDEDIEQLLRGLWEEASEYGERLDAAAAQATRAYLAEPYGDEEEGRSKVVMSLVRDTVRAALPSVLRALVGSARPLEFVEATPQDADSARQATDLTHWALFDANDGWLVVHDAVADALTRAVGWVRWWMEEGGEPRTEEYDHLLEPQLAQLLAEPRVTALRVTRRQATREDLAVITSGPEGAVLAAMPGVPPLVYRATITRIDATPRPRLEAVPGECVRFTNDAATVDGCSGVFVRRRRRVGELVGKGLPRDEVEAAAAPSRVLSAGQVQRARDPRAATPGRMRSRKDPSMLEVDFTEGWIRADVDGDGLAELIYCEAVGDAPKLLRWRRADHVPLSLWSPLREPHRLVGAGMADLTQDLQRTQTVVMRAILDSAMSSIFPRTVIVEGQANMVDALNTEVGAVIRATNPGAVVELSKPFLATQALPVLEVLEAIRESRTGITRGSQGLTAESLQSTTAIAVSAQMSAAQDRLEHIATTLAHTGLRELYRGVARMLLLGQQRPTAVKVRGTWVPVDLARWRDDMGTKLNVSGAPATAQRLQMLAQVAAQQQQALQTMGPSNPLVTIGQLRATLAEIVEVGLCVEPTRYWLPVPADYRPPPQQPKPTPQETLAEVERLKVMGQLQREMAQLQAEAVQQGHQLRADREKLYLDDDRARDIARVDALLRAVELMQDGAPVDPVVIDALLARGPLPPDVGPLPAMAPLGAAGPGQAPVGPLPLGPPAPPAMPPPQPGAPM